MVCKQEVLTETLNQISSNLFKDLSKKYCQIRATRADGNCFFRAFGFSYLEYLLSDRTEYER